MKVLLKALRSRSIVAMPIEPLLLSRRCVWIHRLQAKLLCHLLLLAALSHKGSEIENQIPSLVRLDVVGKRGHGSAVEAGHEYAIDIAIGIAALGTGTFGKVVSSDRPTQIVGESRGGGAVGHTLHAVAFPALHFGKNI